MRKIIKAIINSFRPVHTTGLLRELWEQETDPVERFRLGCLLIKAETVDAMRFPAGWLAA